MRKFIFKPDITLYSGVLVNKDTKLEYKNDNVDQKLENLVLEMTTYTKENNYEARSTLMVASSFSHNNLTNLGKQGLMPIHQLEHELSGLKEEVAHGAGLAVLIPSWMWVTYKYDKDKFIKFAKNVMEVKYYEDDEDLIIKGIMKLEDLFVRLQMPRTLSEFGITEEDVEYMASHLTQNGTFTFPSNVPLNKELALKVYYNCL